MSVLFKGGTVVNATGRYLADVFADGDKIKAIGTDLDNPADEVVDAKGQIHSSRGDRSPYPYIHAVYGNPAPRMTMRPAPKPLPAAGLPAWWTLISSKRAKPFSKPYRTQKIVGRRQSLCRLFAASGGHGSQAGRHRRSQKGLPGIRHTEL